MTYVRTPPRPAQAASAKAIADAIGGAGDVSATTEALDALTALFLSPPDSASKQDTAASAVKPVTELLVLGHLPVRGNLWLTPFADAIAEREGCCGLLRIDDADEFSILILHGQGLIQTGPDASAKDLVKAFAPQTRIWMIRPTSPPNFQQLVTAGADRLTILTGTDGIAVVAAYQLIKDLVDAAESAGVNLPELALAVVGVPEETAAEVVRRINMTAASFLDKPLTLRLCLPQIDAVSPFTQHATFSGETAPELQEVIAWLDEASEQTTFDGHSVPSGALNTPDMPEQDAQQVSPSAAPMQRSGNDGRTNDAAHGHPPLNLAPKPVSDSYQDDALPPVQEPPSLSAQIAGLTQLNVRCPKCDAIELAVDEEGTLNLVCREDQMRHLYSVKAWAAEHRELLAKACADTAINTAANPVCHVVTGTPASVADLHGSGLRLHVLAPVEINGQQGWYSAPLN